MWLSGVFSRAQPFPQNRGHAATGRISCDGLHYAPNLVTPTKTPRLLTVSLRFKTIDAERCRLTRWSNDEAARSPDPDRSPERDARGDRQPSVHRDALRDPTCECCPSIERRLAGPSIVTAHPPAAAKS